MVTLLYFMVMCVSYGRVSASTDLFNKVSTRIQNKTDDTACHVICVLLQSMGVSVSDNMHLNKTHYRVLSDRGLACSVCAVITFADTQSAEQTD